MMRTSAIALVLVLVLSAAALTGENPNCKVAIHVQPHNSKRTCGSLPAIDGCGDIVSTDYSEYVDAFVVFYDLVCIMSYEGAITWPIQWEYGPVWWQGCGDMEISEEDENHWSWSGVFLEGQADNTIVVGWAYIYVESEGMIQPTPHAQTAFIGVDDCASNALDAATCLSGAGVGGIVGDDPCAPSAAESRTWSGIKSMFK
jgi:hypothetical protein